MTQWQIHTGVFFCKPCRSQWKQKSGRYFGEQGIAEVNKKKVLKLGTPLSLLLTVPLLRAMSQTENESKGSL